MHKKIQIPSSILSAFSEALNLAHILKICVSTLAYEQALRPGRPTGSLCGSLSAGQGTLPIVIRFGSVALCLIPMAPKANQSKMPLWAFHWYPN